MREAKKVYPAAIFYGQDEILEIGQAFLTIADTDANQSIVSAVAGKRIRVLSYEVYSTGAASILTFKSGSGGSNVYSVYVPANTGVPPNVFSGWNDAGWFEVGTGAALVADGGAVDVVLSLQYISYKRATAS